MTKFTENIFAYIKLIPKGKVVSYGQVAAACGNPRGARAVGWALRTISPEQKIPWWRVLNNQGIISIKGNWTADKELQRELLRQDGVKVSEEMTVDMNTYRWQSNP